MLNLIADQNYTYLLIAALPYPATYNNDNSVSSSLIQKIEITETAPSPGISFTLTPSSVPIQCGSSVTQAFTINNVNNTRGVTGYQWNLGANNGWNYNGSPAPATISTLSPTISLTSTACASVSNISAVAQIGSSNYNTNASTVNVTLPSLVISGSSSICYGASQTYSISNLPCNATVSWTVSQSYQGIATWTVNGNQITITGGQTSGRVTLSATINNACGGNNLSIPDKAIDIFGSSYSLNIVGWDDVVYTSSEQYLSVDYQYGTDFQWSILSPSSDCGNFDMNGLSMVDFYPWCSGYYTIQVQASNACGTFSTTSSVQVYDRYFMYRMSPNPASNSLMISQNPNTLNLKIHGLMNLDIKTVRVYDNLGNLRKQLKYGAGTKQVQLNISGLKTGIYYIEIGNGQQVEEQKVFIKGN